MNNVFTAQNSDIERRVIAVVGRIIMPHIPQADLSGELIEEATLSSVEVVRMVVALEKEFNVELPDEFIVSISSGLDSFTMAEAINTLTKS